MRQRSYNTQYISFSLLLIFNQNIQLQYFTSALSLCPHLEVNISDPFDDSMRGPYQWIRVLVLTLYPASLECLENILINTFYSTERFYFYLYKNRATCV